MTNPDIHDLLVTEAKKGRAAEIACGLIGLQATAAVLFLRDQIGDTINPEHHRKAVDDTLLARAKVDQYATMAAKKLLPESTPEESVKVLAESVACLVMANVEVHLTARACGANPTPVYGMATLGAQHILKELP